MAETDPPKLNPEALVLRARPPRAVRFKRNLLVGIAAAGCVAIFGVVWIALKTPSLRSGFSGDDTARIGHAGTPDGLSGLPSNYGQLAKAKPQLGPPLPGDLGPPVVEREKQLGVSSGGEPFRPNAEDDAARAERLRLAQQARQAREAGVFFQIARHDVAAPHADPAMSTAAGAATEGPSQPGNRLALDPERDQNNQQRKIDFEKEAAARSIYNDHPLQTPASPYQVMAGTVIAASLLTGVNSDLPGMVVAQVTEAVYDTVTGRILLVPQGARLIGTYDSVIAFGQSRALLVWQRILMPDGSSIQIDNLPATDPAGYTGLEDEVDYHTWTLLKGVVLSTLLGVGSQASFGSSQSNLVQAIQQSSQESTNEAGQRVIEKNLNIQPTITIRPGWPLRVVVHKDLILKPYPQSGSTNQ
jgi:type IV secretion system protein VirB10